MGSMIDHVELGRALKAARILAGHDRVADAAQAVAARGVHCSTRILSAVERGEQGPSLDLVIALMLQYKPPGGMAFLSRAIAPEVLDEWIALNVPPGFGGPPR